MALVGWVKRWIATMLVPCGPVLLLLTRAGAVTVLATKKSRGRERWLEPKGISIMFILKGEVPSRRT